MPVCVESMVTEYDCDCDYDSLRADDPNLHVCYDACHTGGCCGVGHRAELWAFSSDYDPWRNPHLLVSFLLGEIDVERVIGIESAGDG
jgi:hypothetical protein